MVEPTETHVVTCFLRNGGDVLLLKRSDEVDAYEGAWNVVTGFVEGNAEQTAFKEIAEETGLEDACAVVRRGEPYEMVDDEADERRTIHPFLFDCEDRDADPNWESTEAEWASPTELLRRETAPNLWESYQRVAPTPETVTADDEHGAAYVSVTALEALRDRAGALAANSDESDEDDWAELASLADELLDARPAMAAVANRVNWAMNRGSGDRTAAAVEDAAIVAIERAVAADADAAAEAAELVGGRLVFTLSRSATVLDTLERASPSPALVVAESRPALEGVDVAERLADEGFEVTLCPDAASAHLLATRDVGAVLVGADAVFADGRVVNKTGTRAVALAARHEEIPVYAVAAQDKIRSGGDDPDGAALESGPSAAVYDGDADLAVANPTFDVTPASCVAGVVTENGLLEPGEVSNVAAELAALGEWRE